MNAKYCTNGIYFNSSDSIAACPYAHGTLIGWSVDITSKASQGIQFFIGYDNAGLWYRSTMNNSVASWIKII